MKHYATSDDGRPFLTHLSCDEPECEATIKPHPQIGESGWVHYGRRMHGVVIEWAYCPEHAQIPYTHE